MEVLGRRSGDGSVAFAVCSAQADPRHFGAWPDVGSEFDGELWWRRWEWTTASGSDHNTTYCFDHEGTCEWIDYGKCHSEWRNADRERTVCRRWSCSRESSASQQRNDRQHHGNRSQCTGVSGGCGDALRQRELPGDDDYAVIAFRDVERYRNGDDIPGHHGNIHSDER